MKQFYRKLKLALFSILYVLIIAVSSVVALVVLFTLALIVAPLSAINHGYNFYKENEQ